MGSTVWVGSLAGTHLGLAWEWVEVRPGVLMLADPNSIITNILVVDAQQRAVETLSSVVSLNRILHRLPWQCAVGEVLAAADERRTAAHPTALLAAPDQVRASGSAARAA